MKILVVGSELSPLAKTGGLADVLGALPQALAILGHDVRVCIPHYSTINAQTKSISKMDLTGDVKVAGRIKNYRTSEFIPPNSNSITYLIGGDEYFGRDGLYVDPATGADHDDNDLRFSFLCLAALDLVQKLHWRPNIIHAHDWQAALALAYLKNNETGNQFFANTKAVLTIHNMAYQGKFPIERFQSLGLPKILIKPMGPMEYYGESNFLKAGISFADKITTVSNTYAQEIQGKLGCGLEGVLQSRATDVSGILNGVDYSVWSPSNDKHIPSRYDIKNLSGKRTNKVKLLNQIGLPIRSDAPLIAMVTRLVEQKGIQLVIESAAQLFAKNIQMIILGSGDKKLEQQLKFLESKFPDKLKVYLKFDESLAHKIESGADIFLMPSMFEPCGLNQMYSLRYGTIPVVHKVGGLADTVVNYEPAKEVGTGFVFEEFSADAMMNAIEQAIQLFSKKRKWMKLMKNAMKQDFSWKSAAEKYAALFESII